MRNEGSMAKGSVRRRVRLILAGLAMIALASAAAAQEDPADLLGKIDRRYAGVRSLKARFRQKEKMAALGRPRESAGTMMLKKPGRMKWDYRTPDEHLVVASGEIVWIYYPEDKTVYRLPLSPDELARTPLAMLFQEKSSLADHFRAKALAPRGDGLWLLELEPRAASKTVTSVSLLVRPADGTVSGTVIRDAFGNLTAIELDQVAEGIKIEDNEFDFKVPPGAKIMTDRAGAGR